MDGKKFNTTRGKDTKRVIWNTATDTGVGFEAGNTLVAIQVSPLAALISGSVGILCVAARATGEAQGTETTHNASQSLSSIAKHIPKSVKNGLEFINSNMSNLGTSLMISGTALCVSALVAGKAEGIDLSSMSAFYEQGKEAVILGAFGTANFMRGHARGLKDGSTQQKIQDVVGIALASTGVVLTGDILDTQALINYNTAEIIDLGIKATFVGATFAATYEAIKNKAFLPNIRGDLVFAFGCLLNAGMSAYTGAWYAAFANVIFASAFISLDALKNDGGFYQKYIASKNLA